MVHTRLYFSQVIVQILLGTLLPIALLAVTQVRKLGEKVRRVMYTVAASLTMIGIFAMRWNVVIGGQLFSKTFLGYTTYKIGFAEREGVLPAIVLCLLPLGILWVLLKLFPPWEEHQAVRT
jgi:predicted membrane protein